MGRHRRSNPSCPFVLNVSNNVPLASSPQPPPTPQVTPQTSQVDVCPSATDVAGETRFATCSCSNKSKMLLINFFNIEAKYYFSYKPVDFKLS